MHRLVPDFILEQCAAGRVTGSFPAAGLFVDISGFSSVTDDLMVHGPQGAEVLATLMRTVFEPLVQSCYEQGAFITTFAGDAFTALFPTEATTAEATGRALAAAWRIQEHMRAVAENTTIYGTYSLAAKVGMAWGDADWGIVSADDGSRAVFYFRGAAIEDSAAAEHFAGPGDIILTSNFYDGVKEQVHVDAVASENGSVEHHRLLTIIEPLPPIQAVELPAPQLDLLERFHPQGLLTQAYSGEFRHVVNLFISLPTVRTETQLTVFMRSLFALQSRYGGLLNRLDFGDKGSNLLLFWGAPVAHENDVERALNLTLDLQTQTSIPIKAGLTYQIAHAGFVGSPLREDYTCFGRGVNLAARFMTHAGRGEIWVDEAVARRAGTRFELEFEGAMAFKGFAKNQRVYVLYERKEELADVFEGELVGREVELARLLDFASPLEEGGYAGVMVIRGEAGIGKSRLVHAFRIELTASVTEDGLELSWVLCQTDEVLRDSLSPFRYWLRRYFGQSETQAEARNKRSFNRTLDRLVDATEDAELAGELDRTRSFLGALLGLRWPDSLYEELDPEGRHENTLIGLICLLQAESVRRPVILQLEDAQWLDVDSKGLLARLVRTLTADRNREYPIALIVTARPSERGPLLGEDLAYQEIDLGQLSRESLARLAEGQLNGPAAPVLLSLLAERAEGNPFFAEQILRYLTDGNRLRRGDDGWEPTNASELSVVPSDVSALLIARLDQLTQQVKEVVQTAAILGREFEVKLLTQMLLEDDLLSRKVAQAEEAAIWSALTELRYLFKHALLRDAAYRMQVQTRRQSLHGSAVDALEKLFGNELDAHYGELAYHSEQAGRDDKALHYSRLAGDAARDAYQNSQAVDYYGRALKLVPDGDLETRWDLLQAREKVEDLLGQRDAQREHWLRWQSS
jgi:class 3 adenylate cyclase